MIVFGGTDQQGTRLADGGIYNPQLNEWRGLPAIPGTFVPGRHTEIVWTGQEMIVWNGGVTRDGQAANSERRTQTLYRFDPVTNTWQQSGSGWEPFTVSTNSLYQSLSEDGHFVTWTGDRLLVVAKFPDDPSYLYDPLTDAWQPVESPGEFNLIGAATIWVGDRLVHWGGRQGYVFDSNEGLILEF